MISADLDKWQYSLTEQRQPGGIPLGRFWLRVGAGMGVFPLMDADKRPVGMILGFPIDLDARRMLDGPWQAPGVLGTDKDGFIHQTLWALGGRFLLIFAADGNDLRIYPDCTAQVPCVWDATARIAASTAHAFLDGAEYEARLDRPLLVRLGVEGEGWLPAGLTAHRGVVRLLPGHYLDLQTFTAHRFWPTGPIPQATDTDAIIDETVALLQAQMEAVLHSPKRLGLGLTAGNETRVLLACARPFLDRIDTVTVVGQDRHTTDTVIARRIARDFGIRHIELPRREATPAQYQQFVSRGGHCNADSNAHFHTSVWPIADSHIFIGGIGGEVGRGFFWRLADQANTPVTADGLSGRFGLPQTPELTEALDRWIAGLPPVDTFGILDLAYLENRMGPWYAVQLCCDPTLLRIAPLFTFRGCELMLSLPPDWKRDSRLGREIIAKLWPELLRYPFNSLGPWRDALVKLQKIVKNPGLVVKKLRKMRR